MKQNLNISISSYDKENGFIVDWEHGFEIQTFTDQTKIVIKANQAGLISLAKILLSLSQNDVPNGYHIHLDDINSLENNSVELILEKQINFW